MGKGVFGALVTVYEGIGSSMRDLHDEQPPFDASAFDGLLEELGRHVQALYEAERDALAQLGAAAKR